MPPSYKGAITFGLVFIPITLTAAVKANDVSFNMLEKNTIEKNILNDGGNQASPIGGSVTPNKDTNTTTPGDSTTTTTPSTPGTTTTPNAPAAPTTPPAGNGSNGNGNYENGSYDNNGNYNNGNYNNGTTENNIPSQSNDTPEPSATPAAPAAR